MKYVALFTVGLVGILGLRIAQVAIPKKFVPYPSTMVLAPPAQALTGRITQGVGDVKKQSRDDADFGVASAGALLVQGDAVATGAKSQATIEFAAFTTLGLGSVAEAALFDLDPTAFLLQQRSGVIAYTIISADHAVSVRALHTLVRLSQGLAHISVDPQTARVSITIDAGGGILALIDTNNTTQVRGIAAGQTARIDDARRTVQIITTAR